MRLSRFYINPETCEIPAVGSQMELPATVAHHLLKVLRVEVGALIILFNGRGGEYQASVISINKKSATVLIDQHQEVNRESSIETVLAQAVVTGAKMDMVIQKAVELGVNKIVPVIAERCTVNLKDKRAETRFQHWQGIIESACEQCGRNRLPVLEKVTQLFPWAEELGNDFLKLTLQPGSQSGFSDLKKPDHPVLVLIGPEGGFSENELSRLTRADFNNISLGKRVLRTETAGQASLAAIQTLWGDF